MTGVQTCALPIFGALLFLWLGWHLSAKKWFTGPKMTIDLPEGVSAADEVRLEHQGTSGHPDVTSPDPPLTPQPG